MILLLLQIRSESIGTTDIRAHGGRAVTVTGRDAIQTRGARSRATDRTVCAFTEADQAGITLTDIADAIGLVVVVFTHFVSVVNIAATGPGCPATETTRCTGAADGAALFQRLTLEVARGIRCGDLAGCLVAGAGCGDSLKTSESRDAICSFGF